VVGEGLELSFPATASDADAPSNNLTFSLDSGPRSGMPPQEVSS